MGWKVGGIDILAAFYNNPQKYAYLFQAYVLRTRIRQVERARIVERSLLSDKIFATAQHRMGNMTQLEFETYKVMYSDAVRSIGRCAGRIYVKTSVETCMDRIRSRGRQGEESIDLDYLKLLDELHEKAMKMETDVFVIDGEADFNDPAVRRRIAKEVQAFTSNFTLTF